MASKLERLLNLTAALLDSALPLTADQIQGRVGGYPTDPRARHRMFERDKADLREMGVPIRVEPNPEFDPPIDGYRIDRAEYVGADIRFEPDELAALHLATNLVRLDGAEEGLAKLGGRLPDTVNQVGRVPFDDMLATLVGAAAGRRAVRFTYSATERVVEPWRLSFAKGHWYMSGWDLLRDAQRLYRVDRVVGSVHDAGPATHPIGDTTDPGSLRGWELGDSDPITAEIRIDAGQSSWARHVFGQVIDDGDGSVIARVEVRNVAALRSAVLTFLDHAEILSPAALRDDMVAWLEAQL